MKEMVIVAVNNGFYVYRFERNFDTAPILFCTTLADRKDVAAVASILKTLVVKDKVGVSGFAYPAHGNEISFEEIEDEFGTADIVYVKNCADSPVNAVTSMDVKTVEPHNVAVFENHGRDVSLYAAA